MLHVHVFFTAPLRASNMV